MSACCGVKGWEVSDNSIRCRECGRTWRWVDGDWCFDQQCDPDYRAYLADAAKGCRCCSTCWDVPCGGALGGGICDAMRCTCDDEPLYGADSYDGLDGYEGEQPW